MILIDGRYTTDLTYWVRFASERVADAIKSIPVIKGLELTGTLSEADCRSISKKCEFMEVLDLYHAKFPDNTVPENFMRHATQLDCLRLPSDINAIGEYAFADCGKLKDIHSYIGIS